MTQKLDCRLQGCPDLIRKQYQIPVYLESKSEVISGRLLQTFKYLPSSAAGMDPRIRPSITVGQNLRLGLYSPPQQ